MIVSRGETLVTVVAAAIGAVLGGLRGWLTWPAQDD